MGATLATLRKYVRAEVHDPAPTRKISTSSLIHDGGNGAAFFQDATFNFDTLGIEVGDVIWNGSDGGSISTIQQITSGGGTNDKLVVGAIEGGTDNDFDNGDTPYIYDRHAQKGLDGTRFTNTEVEDALAQAQKVVALRFGGVEKFNVHADIKVMCKVDLITISGTFQIGETITGDDNNHAATLEYIGDDFLIFSRFITRVPCDWFSGTFQVGETVTGATNSYTGIVEEVNAAYLDLYAVSGEYNDNETLTGGTSDATATVNSSSTYTSAGWKLGETLTGGTSSATANVKTATTMNNFYVGQDLPTDVKHLINARWWDGSDWNYLKRDSIFEYELRQKSSGDPLGYLVYGSDELSTDTNPSKKIWLWPNNAIYQYNELHLTYLAWDRALSADTTATSFDYTMERLLVLEAAKILAGGDGDEKLFARIVADILMLNKDIENTDKSEITHVSQVIDWDTGYGPGELF
jgi:hypothetical protein